MKLVDRLTYFYTYGSAIPSCYNNVCYFEILLKVKVTYGVTMTLTFLSPVLYKGSLDSYGLLHIRG